MYYVRRLFTPPLTVGETYHSGDVVGGLMVFDLGINKADGYIARLLVVDKNGNRVAPFQLFFFDDAPASVSDNEPFEPSSTDLAKLVGFIEFGSGDYHLTNGSSYITRGGLHMDFELQVKEIYAYAVCMGGTPTYMTDSDLTFKLGAYINASK